MNTAPLPTIAVVILNWNAADDTLNCLRLLTAFKHIRLQIWVVDNHSSDGSAGRIAAEYPHINLICSSTNLGYAAGNNRALVEILEQAIDLILLLNNDATIDETNLLRLVEAMHKYPEIGIVGPMMLDADQPQRLLNAGGQNPVLHLSSHLSYQAKHTPLQLVDYIPGTVMLARRQVFLKTGLLDDAYFFSAEIPDFCHRARRHGFLSAVVTQAKAVHAVERSSTFRESLYVYYIIRNRFRFIRKFYPRLRGLLIGFWMTYSLALAAKLQIDGQPHTAKAVLLGLGDGLRGRFGGQNERVLAVCSGHRPPSFDRLS
ncbi:MAG: glycosyltransferase family 2 protein [Anaerolineaceae bacterium]|nr:glycosyltransferase family 2 protein [Anaerolineaceae bacterium]MCB9100226.1 glycosyltransferase family 2 protein [Anaerolineales bacterium]